MLLGMASSIRITSIASKSRVSQIHSRDCKFLKHSNAIRFPGTSCHPIRNYFIRCQNLSTWEPLPVPYSPPDDSADTIVAESTNNIFETLSSESMAAVPVSNNPVDTDTSKLPSLSDLFLRLPMWLLGPSLILVTGMIPTLWLPISSIFLGPNIASLLSFVGLDCIFNLGATLFLLMADSCARPHNLGQVCNSKAPFSYQFWNLLAAVTGCVVPVLMLLGSQKGLVQPQLPFIAFGVLLGPYLLLLSVQMLTEMLTWHWQSPVWLVTPVVYEGYRLLQLMRSLKLGAEMSAPGWIMHTIRFLVCWWVFILGVQLMRVAWFAGLSAGKDKENAAPADN